MSDEKEEVLSPKEDELADAGGDEQGRSLKERANKKVKIRQGDYVVRVHVIEARGLKGRGIGEMSDPVVVVDCMEKSQSTSRQEATLAPVWDQVLYYEFADLSVASINMGKIEVSVLDANTFRRNELIGKFEFDVATIYCMKGHEVHRQWVALTDVTDEHEGVQGYLKLSIAVLGPDDEQVMHNEDEDEEDDGSMMQVLMPPHIEQKGKLLRVKVYEVDQLMKMDSGLMGGTCDPYVKVVMAGVTVKTEHRKGLSVPILQELKVPVMEPLMSGRILLSLYDWDAVGGDDRMGTTGFDYDDIKESGYGPRWLNIYGAAHGEQRGMASKMNRGYMPGAESTFRGRVLMEMSVEDKEDPEMAVEKIGNVENERRPETVQYTLQLDLYEGSELPNHKHLAVELCIGDHSWRSKEQSCSDGRASWYGPVLTDDGTEPSVTFPKDPSQVPRVYVYICSRDHRLSFTSFPFKQLLEKQWDVPPTWHSFREDVSTTFLGDDFPGILLFSLRVGQKSAVPTKVSTVSRPLLLSPAERAKAIASHRSAAQQSEETKAVAASAEQKTPQAADSASVSSVGTLTVTVIRATDLPIMDRTSSDPYVKLKLIQVSGAEDNEKKRTKTIKENLNPQWNETFTWAGVDVNSSLEVKVRDEDQLGKDDKMGDFLISLFTQQAKAGTAPGEDFSHQDWFLVSDKYPKARVEIKVEFKFVAAELAKAAKDQRKQENEKRKSLFEKVVSHVKDEVEEESVLGKPVYQQFQFRVHIYQARGLPASDASGLADPYVVVRLNGKKIKSSKVKNTVNPAWYKSYSTTVDLPTPLFLAPRVQCMVYDWDNISKDDMIGRFQIEPSSIDDTITPRWYQLYDWNNKPLKDAQVLAAFQLIDAAQANEAMPSIAPPTVPKVLEVTTLGLRDLSSFLGVHKTFISFTMPNGKHFKTNTSMVPNSTNPNFLQVLKIPLDIPKDPLFAPIVDLKVVDGILGGLIQRTIAAGSVSLHDLMTGKFEQKVNIAASPKQEEMDDYESNETEEKSFSQTKAKKQNKQKKQSGRVRGTPGGVWAEEDKEDDQEDIPLLSTASERESDHAGGYQTGGQYGSISKQKSGDHVIDMALEHKGVEVVNAADLSSYEAPDAKTEDEPEDYLKGRDMVDNELEDTMALQPFFTLPLFTGQQNAGLGGDHYHRAGTFKGFIRLCDSKTDKPLVPLGELLVPQTYIVRLYVLRGSSLVPMDDGGSSDPYLVVKCGGAKQTTRDRYLKNTLEPGFFETFEMLCTLPGDTSLSVSVYDWDGVGDDLIGTTVIDLEDRFFTPEWRKIQRKPVEWRTLHCPTSSRPQGKLQLWVEVLDPQFAKKNPPLNIKPPPPEMYELRVIVWGCRDVPIKDEFTNQNDLYVTVACTGVPESNKSRQQQTDTHLRSKKGLGNFNWRMKFPLSLPPEGNMWPRLSLQIWDKDFFSANDSICQADVALKGLCKKVLKKKDRVKILDGVHGEKFWLKNLRHPNDPSDFKAEAKVQVSVELMPVAMADDMPCGFGRSDPNQDPFLPEPEGRVNWRITAPLEMLRELLGPELYNKVRFWFLAILAAVFIYMTAPFIAGVFDIATKIF